jgi:hypothetical protein
MGNDYDYYNLVEKCLIGIEMVQEDKNKANDLCVDKIIIEIKGLAMCLSRFKPADWNKFLDVVIK